MGGQSPHPYGHSQYAGHAEHFQNAEYCQHAEHSKNAEDVQHTGYSQYYVLSKY